jgi:hypothetical protein
MVQGKVTIEAIQPETVYHFRPHQLSLLDHDFNNDVQIIQGFEQRVKHTETKPFLDSDFKFDLYQNQWATPEPIHANLSRFMPPGFSSFSSISDIVHKGVFFCGLLFLTIMSIVVVSKGIRCFVQHRRRLRQVKLDQERHAYELEAFSKRLEAMHKTENSSRTTTAVDLDTLRQTAKFSNQVDDGATASKQPRRFNLSPTHLIQSL